MKNSLPDVLVMNLINGVAVATLTLNEVKDVVAIVLGLVSIVSTLLIIRNNLGKVHHGGAEDTEKRQGTKTEEGERRLGFDPRKILLVLAIGLFGAGCTHVGKERGRADARLERNEAALREESRALTTAVVDVLAGAESDDAAARMALELAQADQVLEGVPSWRLDANGLVRSNAAALAELRERTGYQRRLLSERGELRAKVREAEERLMGLGQKFESERNANVVKRFWRWLLATFGIGGVVALCVFFPAMIPLLGAVMSFAVGKVPWLAGFFGVVSRKAFDGVVKGVGEFRRTMANTDTKEWLDDALLKATDEEHRKLIEARRRSLNV